MFSLEKSRKHWIGLNYTDLRQKAEILLRKLEITFFFGNKVLLCHLGYNDAVQWHDYGSVLYQTPGLK